MYKILFFSLLSFISFNSLSQDFKTSDQYAITPKLSQIGEDYWKTPYEDREPIIAYLVSKADTTKHLMKLELESLETFEAYRVEVMENPGISQVDKVVKLSLEYLGCCSTYENFYLLHTKSGEYKVLPEINYNHCDGPTPVEEYRFTNQEFGKEGKILHTRSFRNDQWQVDSVQVLKTIQYAELDL